MGRHIQTREVPDELHSRLKARAASQGVSMSDYLKRLIEQDLKRPN
ncbi:MAG: toxin-antitoxin system HicB family antitoxin [Pseudomonadota bacterium]